MSITVEAPARAHLGLLQLSSEYSVKFMGIGFAISQPSWRLQVSASEIDEVKFEHCYDRLGTHELEKAGIAILENVRRLTGGPPSRILVKKAIPTHLGLGAKTSFLCAVIAAVSTLSDRNDWESLIPFTGRGGTSGIGVNIARTGGFVLDAGHRDNGADQVIGPSSSRSGHPPAKLVSQWSLPEWPILIATLTKAPRIFGSRERQIFKSAYPIGRDEIDRLAALVLFEIIPAVTAGDKEWFMEGLKKFQYIGFKMYEWRRQDARVHSIRDAAYKSGARCVALSSMGPAVLILGDYLDRVESDLRSLNMPDLAFVHTIPQNHGILIHSELAAETERVS